MHRKKIFGLSAALATPFKSDRSIDIEKLVKHAIWCLNNGCNSVTLLGTTAEATSISPTERSDLLAAFANAGIRDERLVTGIFATDTHSAIAQIQQAVEHRSGKILFAPPFYFKAVSDSGVFEWYDIVLTALGGELPESIVYNLPSQTGVTISPSLISRLRDRFGDRIVGVKDSSGSAQSTIDFLELHGDISILVGDERQLAGAMRIGAEGAICGLANLLPGNMRSIVDSGENDSRVCALIDEACRHSVIPALKVLMSFQFNDDEWRTVRAPLVGVSEVAKTALRSCYEQSSPPSRPI